MKKFRGWGDCWVGGKQFIIKMAGNIDGGLRFFLLKLSIPGETKKLRNLN